MERIPLVVARGTPAAVGRAIGQATASALHAWRDDVAGQLGPGLHWGDAVRASLPYRAAAEDVIPAVVAELDGAADGAGLPRDDLFLLACDEAWTALDTGATLRGCTDIGALPVATADGSLLLGHTNDLGPSFRNRLVAVDRQVDGEPRIFTIGIGPLISIGLNDAGVALGGNALEPNDERVGIPRWLLVRHLLAQATLAGAVDAAVHPARASAYNDVVAHRDGALLNVEASATAAAVTDAAADDGLNVHANHYVATEMAGYEADPAACDGSRARHARAAELARAARGHIDRASLRGLLADHAGEHPICRHDDRYPTVFWCVMDVTRGEVDYGLGQPCLPDGETFAFAH
jgi:isopenicillin-N N-acyltransferase-like protein